MADFSFRSATPADAARLQQIYAHYVLHDFCTFETEAPTETDFRGRITTTLEKGLPYLVAQSAQGDIAGYAYASQYRGERPAYSGTVENSVYVSHQRLGQGLGSHLLATLMEECARLGKAQMIAVIAVKDEVGQSSIKLHEKWGFQHRGTLEGVGKKFGQYLDTTFMQKAL